MAAHPGVFLTDFGLAKNVTTGSRYTRTGETLGTAQYMSPEQACGELERMRPASDVWALGCVLYELLSGGRRAFDGPNLAKVVGAVVASHPPPPHGAPPPVRAVVDACLSKDARRRIANGRALAAALDAVLAGRRPAVPSPARRRWPMVAAVVAIAVVAAVGTVWWAAHPTAAKTRATTPAPPRGAGLAAQGWTLRNSDPAAGAALLQRALAAEPGHRDWRIQLGLLHWAAGQAASARAAWNAVPAAAAEYPTARMWLGLEAMFGVGPDHTIGRYDEAVPILEPLQQRPGRVGVIARAALLHVARRHAAMRGLLDGVPGWEAALLRAMANRPDRGGDVQVALRNYAQALDEGIAFAWVLTNRSIVRSDAGDLDGALRDLDRAAAIAPDYYNTFYNRAVVKARRKDWPGAAADAAEALRLGADPLRARTIRGEAWAQAGDAAKARPDLEFAGARRRDDPELWDMLAWARRWTGDLVGARAGWEHLITLQPGRVNAWRDLVSVLQDLGDHAAVVERCTGLMRLAPDDVRPLVARGWAQYRLGRPQPAMADLDAAVQRAPSHADARFRRALVLEAGRHVRAALADLDAALAADPSHHRARRARGKLRERVGDTAGALADYDRFLAAVQDDHHVYLLRGTLRLNGGHADAARADFEAALRLKPDSPGGHGGMGQALAHLGDHAGAVREFERFLEVEPTGRRADVVRKMLAVERRNAGGR